jgi:hypothetical protein
VAPAAALFSWWATGVPPFTVRAYVAVGIPALLLLVVGIADSLSGPTEGHDPDRGPDRGPDPGPGAGPAPGRQPLQLRRTFPWLLLVLVAVGLEVSGLALGGRSQTVPTLSTVVDHALAWHVVRFVLFCTWIAVGWSPLVRATGRFGRAGRALPAQGGPV